MADTVYIGGKAIPTEEYPGAIIDVPDQAAAVAELSSRLAVQQAAEQRELDTQTVTLLDSVRADVVRLNQLVDRNKSDLDALGSLELAASDLIGQTKKDSAEAIKIARSIPIPDMEKVYGLGVEITRSGERAVNQAVQAAETAEAVEAEVKQQVETLQTEVIGLQGQSTAMVNEMQASVSEAVTEAQGQVQELLNETPEQARQIVMSVINKLEVLKSGEVDPKDKYSFLWQFGPMGSDEITRTERMPIYVGWRGQAGKSGGPVGGGGGGKGGGQLIFEAPLAPSLAVQLAFTVKDSAVAGGRYPKRSALIQWRFTPNNDPLGWVAGTTNLARAGVNEAAFTVAGELYGSSPTHIDLAWTVNALTGGDDMLVTVTSPVAGFFTSVLVDAEGV